MRFHVVAFVLVGAVSMSGCIQADLDESVESVGTAEEHVWVYPPNPTGFHARDDMFLQPARPTLGFPSVKAPASRLNTVQVNVATNGDDGDDDDGDHDR